MGLRKMKRKLRTYVKCFGFLRGLSIAVQELLARHPKETSIMYPGVASPVHLRLNTSDIMVFVHVFQDREYELELALEPRFIIDAGANIGLASIYYANKYPHAKIIAIEPEPSNFALLRKNVAPYANIVAVNKALWSENAMLEIVDPGLDQWGFQTHRPKDGGPRVGISGIEGVTIGKLMDENAIPHVDILKMDIEGAEKEVFRSAGAWIEKVGVIAIELHDRYTMGCSRALYNATNTFDFEFHKGVNIFMARRSHMKVS